MYVSPQEFADIFTVSSGRLNLALAGFAIAKQFMSVTNHPAGGTNKF